MFRALLRAPRRRLPAVARRAPVDARRRLHEMPALQHDFSQGVDSFMTPYGFAMGWTNYQPFLLDKLNQLVTGKDYAEMDTKNIVLATARDPDKAHIFNYASMAHNNHFYYSGICPAPTRMPDLLATDLIASFSSIETLRLEFVYTADAMFGPGFVWLVKAGAADFRVLPTYLAGSPYPGAHWRHQPVDMNTVGRDGSASAYFRAQAPKSKERSDLPPGGIGLEPLLCLSTWEHTWLYDYGFGSSDGRVGGKMAFVDAWWRHINWDKVLSLSGITRPAFK